MFRSVVLIALLLVHTTVNAQYEDDKRKIANTENEGTIYGKFVQRIGFSSGGFPQYIWLMRISDNYMCKVNVKPMMKSKKENGFKDLIPAGKYTIHAYEWTQSKWYGGMMHYELVYKNNSASEIVKKKKDGTLKQEDIEPVMFYVEANKVTYVGTWYFNTDKPHFEEEKSKTDDEMQSTYYFKNIDLSTANVSIPN